MAELAEIGTRGPIAREQAETFKKNLQELVRQGAASVPAIREFLAKNLDTYYAGVGGGEELGYSSFRASLFDALKQIGGPEAQAAMLEAIQTTALPAELLELAKNLDQEAPGQYRGQILNAAQTALKMATANQLGSDVELGPAFRILQNYGEANTTADLAKHDPSSFYNAIAMANLPDAQGLPSLIQMAQKGQIRNNVWEKLAPILGGEQYQLGGASGPAPGGDPAAAGNANYSIVNGATTPDQINQRIVLIDKFLTLVSADSAAAASLQHQRGILIGKLGK